MSKKVLAGWYSTQDGKVMHFFEPWEANDYFLISVCGASGARWGEWLTKRPEPQCKRCLKIADVKR